MKILFFILSFQAFGPAFGYEMDTFVNAEMKKVEGQVEIQKQAPQLNPTINSGLHEKSTETLPMTYRDSNIDHVEPLQSGEQIGSQIDRPQPGTEKVIDLEAPLEKDIAEKQERARLRNNFRKAVQREFVRRAESQGVTTNRNIAEEIKELENQYSP